MLELERLTVSYGGLRALSDVSLVVPEGTVVALLGPNGAGKSTTLRTISGLIPPESGHV
ncbi:MAG: ATP-binding cassette domain-containing protein, partial [Actinobacteria bacterium]|nr:ATP-binding cassette domain-containing protein [Actinomycetota bacterium]